MTKKTEDVKSYTRRDSATSLLRKMGIDSKDYNKFIEKTADGFLCSVAKARRSLERPKKVQSAETISSVCRSMILDGEDNETIFKTLQKKFGIERFGPEKRHYPSWYRCELRRKGELPVVLDTANLDPNVIHKMED